ncbi:gag-pol polyprotein [Tanacetum coccineum]
MIVAMATKFEIKKFNRNNFSLWKLKMKVILRKDKCLAGIGERPAEVTDDSKWDEMDENAMVNLHLTLAGGVLSSIKEKKSANEIWDHLARLYEARSLHNKNFLKRKLYVLRMTESTLVNEHSSMMLPPLFWKKKIGTTTRRAQQQGGHANQFKTGKGFGGDEREVNGIGSSGSHNHDDLGCKVEIQNKIMKFIKGALVLIRGEKVAANLYWLKGEIIEEAEASVASHSPSHRVGITWNHKLGLKQHRLKFKTSNSRSVYFLELVHSDVWQAPVLSLGRVKYFVSFIDDYSKRCWVYPIKKKSDVFEVFKVNKAWVELDSGKKIKCLRTDNGGEYIGDEFDTFCRQEEIKRQFTTAYTP